MSRPCPGESCDGWIRTTARGGRNPRRINYPQAPGLALTCRQLRRVRPSCVAQRMAGGDGRIELVIGAVGQASPHVVSPERLDAEIASHGLGGGSAMLRRHDREECLHVQAQTRTNRQGAVFIQSSAEASSQRRAHQAGEFETGAGAGTAAPAGRRHHRVTCTGWQPHSVRGVFCRRGAQEARAEA
jgi:hypothetical protein